MTREDPQLKLRLAEDLKVRVAAAAKANNRSVNAEIVAALEDKYPAPDSDLHQTIADLLHQLEAASPERKSEIQVALSPLWDRLGGVFK